MTRALIAQKSTRRTFRLPLTTRQAFDMLMGAYKAEVVLRQREFVEDEAVKRNVMEAAEFLTDSSGKFGLMLLGDCGNGKTTLLYALQNLLNYLSAREVVDGDCAIRIIDAREVAELTGDREAMRSLKREPMLGIDDMGRESAEVMDYGNVRNPVADLLEYRYDQRLFTALTSNLSVDELKSRYGRRLADRFREMFEKITFKNPTYR